MMLEEKHIEIRGIKFRYILKSGEANTSPLLFLHGFTGSANDWIEIIEKLPSQFQAYAIDLIGHGKTENPEELTPYLTENQIDQIDEFISRTMKRPPIILGYSMGGRLALQYAVHKNNLKGLILESTTAGIISNEEREARVISDANLVRKIEEQGIEQFIDYWMDLPLFQSLKKLPQSKYDAIVSRKKECNKTGLINSLRGFGAGMMPHVWDKLTGLVCPSMIIAGSSDTKYTSISQKLTRTIPGSLLKIINDAGHNTHLEKPEEFLNFVIQFLNTIEKGNHAI